MCAAIRGTCPDTQTGDVWMFLKTEEETGDVTLMAPLDEVVVDCSECLFGEVLLYNTAACTSLCRRRLQLQDVVKADRVDTCLLQRSAVVQSDVHHSGLE